MLLIQTELLTADIIYKISPVWDWRSTLHNWRLCQKTRITSKIRPDQI